MLSSRDPGFRQPAQGSVHFLGPGGLVRVTPKWVWDMACPGCLPLHPRRGVCSRLGSTQGCTEVLIHGSMAVALGGHVIRADR